MAKGYLSGSLGGIEISPEVIAQYAGTQAIECFGVVGMAAMSMKDGLMHLLKRESLSKGIIVEINENRITLEFHIIVAYDVNAVTVAQNLIENVRYKAEEFTGMKIDRINVCIEGVKVID